MAKRMMSVVLALLSLLLCSQAALPAEVEKLACKALKTEWVETHVTDGLCKKLTGKFPPLEPKCESLMTKVYNEALSKCPSTMAGLEGAAPSPADIEKLICEVASQKSVQEEAKSGVCGLVPRVVPNITEAECESVFSEAWDIALNLCPKRASVGLDPATIEKLVCEVASRKEIEEHAVGEVCAKVTEMFPSIKFDPNCTSMLSAVWDEAVALCPQRQQTSLAVTTKSGISPEVEKMLCTVASEKGVEDKVLKVCDKLFGPTKLEHDLECKLALRGFWQQMLDKCPKTSEAPSPEEIEKLICEYASKQEVEQEAIKATCAKISEMFPSTKSECPTMLEAIWERAVAKCPKGLVWV